VSRTGLILRLSLSEARHAFRQALPPRVLRLALVAALLLFEGALLVLLLRLPGPIRQAPRFGFLVGFVGFNLLAAFGAAGVAVAGLLAHPERLTLLLLSPLAPGVAVHVALAPAVLAALCPVTLLGLPFILARGHEAPLVALGLGVAGAGTLGWAVTAAVTLASWLGRRRGRERGARLLRALAGWLAFAALFAFRWLVDVRTRASVLLVFLVVTPLLLPWCWSRATRVFAGVLLGTEPAPLSPEPTWGKPGWPRLLLRALEPAALLAVTPALAVAVLMPGLRRALGALLAVQLVSAPLDRLLEAELACPDRWRLAPEGGAMRRRLLTRWGGGAVALVLALGTALGWGHWRWLAALGAASAAVPWTYLITSRTPRIACQLALLGVALLATTIW
jgi:hypothetical protein